MYALPLAFFLFLENILWVISVQDHAIYYIVIHRRMANTIVSYAWSDINADVR